MSVAGILLAAGGGRRFGAPKAMVVVGGQTLAERGIDTLRRGGCAVSVIVAGADWQTVARQASAHVVVNPHWSQGISTSLRAGLDYVATTEALAAVVALVDQPLITPAAVSRLLRAWERDAIAAVATYEGQRRNPLLLDRSVWREVAQAATGDAGARSGCRVAVTHLSRLCRAMTWRRRTTSTRRATLIGSRRFYRGGPSDEASLCSNLSTAASRSVDSMSLPAA